jgi:hypothetical protein
MEAVQPAVADYFYPSGAQELAATVDRLLAKVDRAGAASALPPKAIIAPHAGYIYSGPVAARAYATLAAGRGRVRRAVVIGPAHYVWFAGVAAPSSTAFQMPLGALPVDRRAIEALRGLPWVGIADAPHVREHALEVQLPFLQRVLGEVEIVPLLVGDARWRLTKRGEAFRARVVAYADDFVIVSRGQAAEALTWTKAAMTKLRLTLNEVKTSLKDARQERFDFLGYSFGPHRYKANGQWYLGASPSKKSVQRLKTKVGNLLVPGNNEPWSEVRDTLNRSLLGWSNYFSPGTRRSALRGVDRYVYERVRDFLARRHKVAGRGTKRFSCEVVYGERGLLRLERLPLTAPSCASR